MQVKLALMTVMKVILPYLTALIGGTGVLVILIFFL